MIRFRCPHCRQPNQQADEQAGQVVCCLSCGKRLRVPQKRQDQSKSESRDSAAQAHSRASHPKSSKPERGEVDWTQLAAMEQIATISDEVETFELRQQAPSQKHVDSQKHEEPNEESDDPNDEVDSSYKPSGRIGIFSIVIMPIGALVTAGLTLLSYELGMGLLGAAFGFVEAGMGLGFVPRMFGALGGRACFWASLPCFLGALVLPVAGTMVSSLLSKNRSRLLAALFAGVTVLLVLGVLVIQRDPEGAARQVEAVLPKNQQPAPPSLLVNFLRYQLWIEIPVFCLFAIGAAVGAALQVGEQYFCEKCKKYLKEPKCHYWSLGVAEIVSKPLRQKNISAVLHVMRSQESLLAATDGECARMEIHSCPDCGQAVVNVFDVVVVDVTDEGEKVVKATRRASVWVSKKEARQLKSPHSDRWIPQP